MRKLLDRLPYEVQSDLLAKTNTSFEPPLAEPRDRLARREARQMLDEKLGLAARQGDLLGKLDPNYRLEEDIEPIERARERLREAAIAVLMIEDRIGQRFDMRETLDALLEQLNRELLEQKEKAVALEQKKMAPPVKRALAARAEAIIQSIPAELSRSMCHELRPLGGNPLKQLEQIVGKVALAEYLDQEPLRPDQIHETIFQIIDARISHMEQPTRH